MDTVCEARIPTYRRPDWLLRALESLRAQSHPRWSAVVLDDSPDREAEEVVRTLRDDRVTYRPNSERLGAAGNIDQAFAPQPMAGGACAFVLEDDAALQPDFLRENLRSLDAGGTDVLLRNQAIHAGADWHDTGETTRGAWLEAGIHRAVEIHALLLFMEGISNGGLFWRLERGIDLRVGPSVSDAGLQEYCRTLLIRQPLLFAAEPLAIFTLLPAHQIARSVTANRVFARGGQAIRRTLLTTQRDEILPAARAIAARTGRAEQLAQSLLEAGAWPGETGTLSRAAALKAWLKGAIRRRLVADPVDGFLNFLRAHP